MSVHPGEWRTFFLPPLFLLFMPQPVPPALKPLLMGYYRWKKGQAWAVDVAKMLIIQTSKGVWLLIWVNDYTILGFFIWHQDMLRPRVSSVDSNLLISEDIPAWKIIYAAIICAVLSFSLCLCLSLSLPSNVLRSLYTADHVILTITPRKY
jgi:hypothetical protein